MQNFQNSSNANHICNISPGASAPKSQGEAEALVNIWKFPEIFEAEKQSKQLKIKRYFAKSRFQKLIKKSGVEKSQFLTCGLVALPKKSKGKDTGHSGFVEIHKYTKHVESVEIIRHGYKGLSKCSNAHYCPTCSSKILAHRRSEIAFCGEHLLKSGYQILFITFTAPHEYSQKNSYWDSIKRFNAALDIFTRDKYQLKKYGYRFSITSAELTVDEVRKERRTRTFKTGIHWHKHCIYIFDRDKPFTKTEAKNLKKRLSQDWLNSLCKIEYLINPTEKVKRDVLKQGVDIRLPWVAEDGELETAEKIEKLAAYVCKGLAFETASINTKEGKNPNRMSLFDYLDVVSSDTEKYKKELWRVKAIFTALKYLSKIRFSQGLKEFCGLKHIEDEEIFQGEGEEMITFFPHKSPHWKNTYRRGLQQHYLNAFDENIVNSSNALEALKSFGKGKDYATGAEINEEVETQNEIKNKLDTITKQT